MIVADHRPPAIALVADRSEQGARIDLEANLGSWRDIGSRFGHRNMAGRPEKQAADLGVGALRGMRLDPLPRRA